MEDPKLLDWANECGDAIANAIAGLSVPIDSLELLNPFRRDPDVQQVPIQLKIEQFYRGQWWEQRLYVVPGSVGGKEKANFELSTAQYTLQDIGEPTGIPFTEGAVRGMRVRIRSEDGGTWYFKGYVEDVGSDPYAAYSDNTDRRRIQVSCVNEMGAMRDIPIKEIVTAPTEGAMLADLTARYCPEFDISGINLDFGQPITRRAIDGLYLYQVYEEVLKNNPNGAFYLDITQDRSRIYLDDKSVLALRLPVTLTDANLYQYCKVGDFKLNNTGKTYRNRVRYICPRLYNQGTIDGEINTTIIYGTGTGWFDQIFIGDRIRRIGSNNTYTVTKNNSTQDGSVEELYVSPALDADFTAADYEVIQGEFETVAEDRAAIEQQALVTGRSDEFAGVVEVIIRDNNPMTEEEAERLAELSLRLKAYEGYFRTNSRLFYVRNLRAGMSLPLQMPLRGWPNEFVPIQEIEWSVRKGWAEPREDSSPRIDYLLSLTDRSMASESILRQLLLAGRRARVKDEQKLTIYMTLSERAAYIDCLRATQGEAVDEKYSTQVTAKAFAVPENTFPRYPLDLAPGQLAAEVFDPDQPDTYWYPLALADLP